MPTAAKTISHEYSPSREEFDSSSLPYLSRYSSRIQGAKQTLSHIIGETSSKKSMNQETLDHVSDVNREAR